MSPTLAIFTYSGMMIDWTGMIIPARIPTNRSGASGNRSFANAKPAIVLTSKMSATEERVTTAELTICCMTGSWSSRATQLSSEKPSPERYWSGERNDTSTM